MLYDQQQMNMKECQFKQTHFYKRQFLDKIAELISFNYIEQYIKPQIYTHQQPAHSYLSFEQVQYTIRKTLQSHTIIQQKIIRLCNQAEIEVTQRSSNLINPVISFSQSKQMNHDDAQRLLYFDVRQKEALVDEYAFSIVRKQNAIELMECLEQYKLDDVYCKTIQYMQMINSNYEFTGISISLAIFQPHRVRFILQLPTTKHPLITLPTQQISKFNQEKFQHHIKTAVLKHFIHQSFECNHTSQEEKTCQIYHHLSVQQQVILIYELNSVHQLCLHVNQDGLLLDSLFSITNTQAYINNISIVMQQIMINQPTNHQYQQQVLIIISAPPNTLIPSFQGLYNKIKSLMKE